MINRHFFRDGRSKYTKVGIRGSEASNSTRGGVSIVKSPSVEHRAVALEVGKD
jgi:hypothetical protein